MILKISQLLRIFYAPSNDKKGIEKKKNTQSNMLFNPFATLFLNLQKNIKTFTKKTVISLKFNMNANTYEKS